MSRQTKEMCLIPGGLHSLPESAKGISDDAIWTMQKSAEAIVVVLGNEGLNQQNPNTTQPHEQKGKEKGFGRSDDNVI
jgi:hypothetical protein